MAVKIYLSGGAVNIEGKLTNILIINPRHFDWQKKGAEYHVRDGIENASYNLGALANIQDADAVVYASATILTNVLNSFVNAQGIDFDLAVSCGKINDVKAVNKFGHAPAGIQITVSDIWDLANATPTQQIWLAPTAARIHALVSTDTVDTAGLGTLTLTGLPLDTETVTIGSKVYTFQTVLTDVDGNVLIGATASDSIDNLIAGIMLTAGAGTTYAASMTAGDDVVATVGAGDTMLVYDQQSATLSTTEGLTNGSWGASTITPGTGARKIKIYGLTDWNSAETNETIIMHGDVAVNTVNSYVIIHRMEALTYGTSGPNAGTITATAATDSTITAVMLIGNGQTEMAIYGVPSTKKLALKRWRCNIDKNIGAVASADFQIRVNESPNIQSTIFIRKHDISLQSTGSTMFESDFNPPLNFPGPCILKIAAIGSAADLDGESSFDGYLIDN